MQCRKHVQDLSHAICITSCTFMVYYMPSVFHDFMVYHMPSVFHDFMVYHMPPEFHDFMVYHMPSVLNQ